MQLDFFPCLHKEIWMVLDPNGLEVYRLLSARSRFDSGRGDHVVATRILVRPSP